MAKPQQHRLKARASYLIGGAVTLAFGGFVEWKIGWRTLLAPWLDVPKMPLAVAFGLVFASYAARALRLRDYTVLTLKTPAPLVPCLKLILQHNVWVNLLPMRAGELTFPLLMARYFGVPVKRSLLPCCCFDSSTCTR